MKKIYIKPEAILTTVELQSFIALSMTEGSATKSEVLSRESDWDDEY